MSSPLPDATGYLSKAYVRAVGGGQVSLSESGGYLARRPIGPTGLSDLAGAWPIFTCRDWAALGHDLDRLQDAVSAVMVADPFNPLGQAGLSALFPLCRKLHDHWLIDLTRPVAPSKSHRARLRKAGSVRIEVLHPGLEEAAAFARLYAHLRDRKAITDVRAFDETAIAAQCAVSGAEMVLAWDGDQLLGADLYYLDRGRAFAHLSAYAPEGYARSVSYPMMAAAIDHFQGRAEVIDLGGAPAGPAGEGMAMFKRGWANGSRESWLCGRILDPVAYAALVAGKPATEYFPAYRRGEYQTA